LAVALAARRALNIHKRCGHGFAITASILVSALRAGITNTRPAHPARASCLCAAVCCARARTALLACVLAALRTQAARVLPLFLAALRRCAPHAGTAHVQQCNLFPVALHQATEALKAAACLVCGASRPCRLAPHTLSVFLLVRRQGQALRGGCAAP